CSNPDRYYGYLNSNSLSTASHTNTFLQQTCLPTLTSAGAKLYFPSHDGLRRGLSCTGTESPSNARGPPYEPGSAGSAPRNQPGINGQYRSRPPTGAFAPALADRGSASYEID